jgi:hypothetical protein
MGMCVRKRPRNSETKAGSQRGSGGRLGGKLNARPEVPTHDEKVAAVLTGFAAGTLPLLARIRLLSTAHCRTVSEPRGSSAQSPQCRLDAPRNLTSGASNTGRDQREVYRVGPTASPGS